MRKQVLPNGEIVEKPSEILQKREIEEFSKKLFSQFGWEVKKYIDNSDRILLELQHFEVGKKSFSFFPATIRDESRNELEKKIQLGGKNPAQFNKKETIILGFYISSKPVLLEDIIFVGYPVSDNINYGKNPSIRKTFVDKILRNATIYGFYLDEDSRYVSFKSQFIHYYLKNFYNLHYGKDFQNDSQDNNYEQEKELYLSHNQIFSGAPGTGKSYNVSKLVKEYYPDFENEENEQSQFVFRTTLHPEYTYSDFVGQIMPVTKDDKIDYDFIPGVFTRALEKAISFEQTNQKVFLILEELSRANVASVFGDLFQLLDRKNGKSEYPISNSLIAKEVFHSGPLKNEDGSINKENEKLQNKKIYLPSNLYILCTVNTSDQNVFVMDTAFKRRFDWIPVLTDPVKNLKTGDYINNPEITIDGVKLKWCEFYPILNNYITSKMGLSEDKQIGQFFIKFDDNSSTEVVQTLLKNKLLQYLWDDVENAAYSKKLFEGITSFSELYKKFGVTQIFNAELITALNNIKNSDIEITNDNQSIELNNNVELDENLVEE
ncbi:AAA family ATPase [Streptococcus uberis]|nr:AAA family ATPase [Streptococcus uberis]MCK1200974.1 AAA family ATPase [Streptococcus uberis]MCK1204470.1 AAA family ATPase [Streptococcus uberis]